MKTLQEQADIFANVLNNLVSNVFHSPPEFGANVIDDFDFAVVAPSSLEGAAGLDYPLIRTCDNTDTPVLFLRARYYVQMDEENEYLRIKNSNLGLFVRVGNKKDPKPIIRVEYDRTKAAADVHIHANSPELAWVYGSAKKPAPNLHSLHFPVGGRRFRPTLEEFLLFLDRENLVDNWQKGWKNIVTCSLDRWDKCQAKATVRRFPDEAIEVLRSRGYQVYLPS